MKYSEKVLHLDHSQLFRFFPQFIFIIIIWKLFKYGRRRDLLV